MWPFKSEKHAYQAIAVNDVEVQDTDANIATAENETKNPQPDTHARRNRHRYIAAAICLAVLAGPLSLIALSFSGPAIADPRYNPGQGPIIAPPSPSTKHPLRREWRSLSKLEQQTYISAVRCLLDQPSAVFPSSNGTAYGDWPWIHSRIGYRTHHTASFLPWHRYFLHVYETTLRSQCGYEGRLVYWDWTLDWESLESSAVFDAETGFGGDGEVGGDITVSKTGRCVVDGPFKDVVADYYDVEYRPHCLSRGFRDLEGKLGHIDGHDVRPESIEQVLSLDSYEAFVTAMESRVHDVIPYGISGDFETFTAPYDPLFFLHHVQLDRLWWLWQLRQPGGGLEAYGGHKGRHSMEMANLEDEIGVGGLATPIKVRELMDIHGGMLGYDY